MGKKLLLPGVALALGAGGFALRRLELATAFEPSGLPIPGAPTSIGLACLSLAAMAVLGLLSWRFCRGKGSEDYAQAFAIPDASYLTALVSACALLAVGGVMGVMHYVNHSVPRITHLLVGVMALASALCIFLTAKNTYQKKGEGRYSGLLLVPAFSMCLWLVSTYQLRAGDPIILDYVYQILAIITLLLTLYFTAGFSFEKGRTALTLWMSGLTVYFSGVTLADGHQGLDLWLHIFAVVYGVYTAVLLLHNLTAEKEEPPHE